MMKNSIKILILAGFLTHGYGCAMDDQMSKSLNLGQSDIQPQEQVFGQDVLEEVKEILSSLRKEAKNVNDPEVAKKIVTRYLEQVANATQTNLLELQLIADQAIDIAAQDIDEQNQGLVIIQGIEEQGEAGFNKAFKLIAQGLNKAIITSLGVAGGVVIGAGIVGIGIPASVIKSAYRTTVKESAPFGEFENGDSFATKAVKLLPNILSRALAGVVSATAVAAIGAIAIPAIVLMGGVAGGHIANLSPQERKFMRSIGLEKTSKLYTQLNKLDPENKIIFKTLSDGDKVKFYQVLVDNNIEEDEYKSLKKEITEKEEGISRKVRQSEQKEQRLIKRSDSSANIGRNFAPSQMPKPLS
jgi:hypothetical protein